MRKLVMTAIIAALFATSAHADNQRNAWILPLIGGIIIGNELGKQHHQYPQPRYYNPPQYYPRPRYYQPVIVCQYVAVYDDWGYYMGQQKQCWEQ